MSELDELARRHASAALAAYADVRPPTLHTSTHGQRVTRGRAGISAAVVGVLFVAALVAAVTFVSASQPDPLTPAGSGEDPSPATSSMLAQPTDVVVPEGWEVVGDLPVQTVTSFLTAPLKDAVVVVGFNGTWLIEADGTWMSGEAAPGLSTSRADQTLIPTAQGPVLVASGSDEAWILDPETLTWHRAEPRPSSGIILGSAVVDGQLLVVEAAPRRGATVASAVASLDLQTLSWRTLEPVPKPISVGGVTSDGQRLFVAGTRQGASNDITGDHVAFEHAQAGGWEALPEVPISGQSATVQWLAGAGLLAWNYDLQAAVLDSSGAWQRVGGVPLPPSECRPRSSPTAGGALGECEGLARFDAATRQWSAIGTDGLPTETDYVVSAESVVGLYVTQTSNLRFLRYSLTDASATTSEGD